MKKVIAFILFVIVVAILTIILWKLLSNIFLLSSYSKEKTPVTPGTTGVPNSSFLHFYPENLFGFDNTAPQISKKDLGEISPLSGKLSIVKDNSSFQDKKNEYLYIVANINNDEPVKISGMLLQSLTSNKLAIIPKGVEKYILGQINVEKDIYLNPGEAAFVHTGKSPLGVSFKTNMCSGYLNEFKKFAPKLPTTWCPSPRSLMPNTVENIKKYGDSCISYVQHMPRCSYYKKTNIKVSKQCESRLKTIFTYNWCVDKYQDTKQFYYPGAVWHIYLQRDSKLWKDKYEVIKLMDSDSKTVSAISY